MVYVEDPRFPNSKPAKMNKTPMNSLDFSQVTNNHLSPKSRISTNKFAKEFPTANDLDIQMQMNLA